MQNHYNNEKGSLYQFAEDHGLNSWEFDLIKRIVRCRKKGQFREDLEKSKFLIDLYLLEFSHNYAFTAYQEGESFSVSIYDKGKEIKRFQYFETIQEAEISAKKWIKAQEEEPTPAPVTTYSYSVIENPGGGFDFTVKDKGEEVYQYFGYATHLDATQAAQEWIKEQTEEPEQEEPEPKYSYEEWLKSQEQA